MYENTAGFEQRHLPWSNGVRQGHMLTVIKTGVTAMMVLAVAAWILYNVLLMVGFMSDPTQPPAPMLAWTFALSPLMALSMITALKVKIDCGGIIALAIDRLSVLSVVVFRRTILTAFAAAVLQWYVWLEQLGDSSRASEPYFYPALFGASLVCVTIALAWDVASHKADNDRHRFNP